jgi:hypothetical protein
MKMKLVALVEVFRTLLETHSEFFVTGISNVESDYFIADLFRF